MDLGFPMFGPNHCVILGILAGVIPLLVQWGRRERGRPGARPARRPRSPSSWWC
jgi:hypothetical protein